VAKEHHPAVSLLTQPTWLCYHLLWKFHICRFCFAP